MGPTSVVKRERPNWLLHQIRSLTDSKRDVSANMGKGNAQQAAQKRERNAKKNATSTASSQLKSNEKALSIICNVCKQTFLCTSNPKTLKEHADNKHPKNTFAQCFPTLPPQ